MMIRKKLLLLVFLLPLFFVVHGFAANLFTIPVHEVFFLWLAYCGLALVIYLFACIFSRRLETRVWITLAVLFFFFFFGPLHDSVKSLAPGSLFSRYTVFTLLLLIVLAGVLWALLKMENKERLHRYVFMVLLLLIAFDSAVITYKLITRPEERKPVACSNCDKPDVYFFVLDEYAGKNQLEKDFSFDNKQFLDSLRSMGFYVANNSTSNYKETPFSMASLLNMEYNDDRKKSYVQDNIVYCFKKIYSSVVVKTFLKNGYQFFNNSIFDIQGYSSSCEHPVLIAGIGLINSQTFVARIRKDIYPNVLRNYFPGSDLYKQLVYEDQENIVNQEKLLFSVKKEEKPLFIYTHFMMPHFPYYFNKDGKANDFEYLQPKYMRDKGLYLDYLEYTNNKILGMVHKIQNNSKKPPVIILLGDHGFRYAGNDSSQFSTFAAIRLPENDYKGYYDSISNVNQFRVLFNKMFGNELPLLKDEKIELEY